MPEGAFRGKATLKVPSEMVPLRKTMRFLGTWERGSQTVHNK